MAKAPDVGKPQGKGKKDDKVKGAPAGKKPAQQGKAPSQAKKPQAKKPVQGKKPK